MVKKSNNNSRSSPEETRSLRDPAAIKRVYDFSNLAGSALDVASKQRLLSGAKIRKEDALVGVELGHFVVRNFEGNKEFACQRYSKIVLEFEGDGMALGGNKPSMEVEGNCEISQGDINAISPLWIPVAKILGEPVAEGEFDFREGHPIKVRFTNVMSEWPTAWRMKSVRLIGATAGLTENRSAAIAPDVLIDDKELRTLSDKPLILKFK
jgi:hypothetical protein